MTLSEELSDYFARTPYDAIPDKVIERAKHVVLYHLGLAVRGVAENDFNGAQAVRIARRLGPGDGLATIVGSERGAMPIDAAFANTTQIGPCCGRNAGELGIGIDHHIAQLGLRFQHRLWMGAVGALACGG